MQPPTTTVTQPATSKPTVEMETHPISVTRFTTFGIGRSYLFNATGEKTAEEYWQELFAGYKGWSFDQLENYDKPLGETATLSFNTEVHTDAKAAIEALQRACEIDLLAQLVSTSIQVCFFTTGVAVMSMRLISNPLDDGVEFLDRIEDDSQLEQARKWLRKIIDCCTENYLAVMDKAESDKRSPSERGWSLKRYREVDRVNWKPKARHSVPLFFVTDEVYQRRTDSILQQVPSQNERMLQSDRSRVPYQGAEIYVDWSEALVKNAGSSRELIERNFLIAFASWFALVLMNKNSSLFLFEAHLGMIEKNHRSTAAAVHQRNMAYKDVSDASLPIRWTTRRRDLFLLETIHRNWSSERWRNNIEERMKLVALHYKSLEDEGNERSTRFLGLVAVFLALVTLASAIADVINLAENDGEPSRWVFLGFPLKQIDICLSLVPLFIAIPFAAWWFGLPAKIWGKLKRQ